MLSSRTICSRCATRATALATVHQRSFAAIPTLTEAIEAEAGAGHEKRRGPHSQRAVSRHQRHKKPHDSAVALFNDVVKPESAVTSPTRSTLDEWAIAGKLKALEEMNASTKEKLHHFDREIWPQMSAFRGQMPKHLYTSTAQFMRRSYEALISSHDLESSVKLAQLWAKTGNWDISHRNGLVLDLCHALISGEKAPEEKAIILKNVNRMWEHITQVKRRSQAGKGLKYVLPTHHEILQHMAANRGQAKEELETGTLIPQSLAALFPQLTPEQSQKLATGLLATLAILSEDAPEILAIRNDAALLLDRLDVALQQTKVSETDITHSFSGVKAFPNAKLAELETYVLANWPKVPALLSKDATWRQKLKEPRKGNTSYAKGLDSFHVKLRAVYRTRNAGGAASALWIEFQNHLAKHPESLEQLRDNPELMDFWVFVWCAVLRSNKLQETLTIMQDIGMQPTIKTYTAMMHGWKMCKDINKIEALWEKLVESGFPLDVVIWTERISALVELGKTQKGIQALAEMLSQWKEAHAKNPNTTAPKPNTEVVNAVFKGIVAVDPSAARAVLSWAGREGIPPNIRTFNILLRESFKKAKFEEVQNILKTMQDYGIEPDAATFTIMLEEVLGNMHNAPAADQVQAVEHILSDIQLAGVKANPETYGKMLYAVAALPQAEPAIAAIQAHMRKSGFAVTPHMVTILIERALGQSRPDIRAVQALLREHQLTHVRQGDQTLWERVMSAYAVTNNVDDALKVFDDLARAGRSVTSLSCLKDLLSALLDAGRSEDASKVVSTVMQTKLKSAERLDDRYWRHHFWHLARQHGLLKQGMALPDVEQ